jgi:beta-mannosidase
LAAIAPDWIGIPGPATVAACLADAGRADRIAGRDLDAEDWWFRCRFPAPPGVSVAVLRFPGLATVADVWLNGDQLLHSDSMFVSRDSAPTGVRPEGNELLLRFHALTPLLAARRPRPRWRTALVTHQQLRWHRTTLLGRIPGWCPPIAPVGPWGGVTLIPESHLRVVGGGFRAAIEGDTGTVAARLVLGGGAKAPAEAHLVVGSARARLEVRTTDEGVVASGVARVPGAERWWPHTHGDQPLYDVSLEVRDGGADRRIELGRTGFRTLAVERGDDGNGFGLRINGEPVFCRGACWTPLDLARLHVAPGQYLEALRQARAAGMNMLRIGGTMVYESDAFYDACDALGILVWQDFMFANMDYPAEPSFLAAVEDEARGFLPRVSGRPSLAVLCGSSELEQQAAMLGLGAELWSGSGVAPVLERCAGELTPDVPWVSSSPSGGTLPFHTNRGVAHYYGVGAYRRPFDDTRRAGVRFASECLAFSNVGEPGVTPGTGFGPEDPRWKDGVPRDPGADWDFENVRDHYLQLLFGADPAVLREASPERYLDLGRLTTGEVMERVIGEWRRDGSPCRGALVWLLRDLGPGPGWGVVDVRGRPKPAWWYLRRAFAPVALFVTDEGLNGLTFHAVNDTKEPIEAELRVSVYRNGEVLLARSTKEITIPSRGHVTALADALFPGFLDLSYAYRFGPPGHNLVAGSLTSAAGRRLGSAFHWPVGMSGGQEENLGLSATAADRGAECLLTLKSARAALGVSIEAPGFEPDDNWLKLEPETPLLVRVRRISGSGPFEGRVGAVNGLGSVGIVPQP